MKGKAGKYCPFREGHKCGDYCGLFCVGLNSCVFHAINKNMMDAGYNIDQIDRGIREIVTELKEIGKSMPPV